MTREPPSTPAVAVATAPSTIVVRNKVPNEKVLRMAMLMGLISPQEHDFLVALGDSKELDRIIEDMAEQGLDMLVRLLKQLGKDRLIEIT